MVVWWAVVVRTAARPAADATVEDVAVGEVAVGEVAIADVLLTGGAVVVGRRSE